MNPKLFISLLLCVCFSCSNAEIEVEQPLHTNTTSNFDNFQSMVKEQPLLIFSSLAATVLSLVIAFRLFAPQSKKMPPTISGPIPWVGCAFKYGVDPPKLLKEGYEKFGEIFSLYLFGERMTILSGPETLKLFFQSKEDVISANEAYRFTVPVFGKGVVYDVDPEILVEQKRMIKDSLTLSRFKKYVDLIVEETENFFEREWGDSGEKNLLSAFSEVTVFTSTRCLQGQEVRDQFTTEFAELYADLDAALSPVGFFFPNAPLPSMRRRDKARKRLGELFAQIIENRKKNGKSSEEDYHDILSTLTECTYKDGTPVPQEEVVGMLIALLLAGQHTSNVTGTWLGLMLMHNKEEMKKVLDEQERVMNGKDKLGYDELKEMVQLERAMKETLRMRPPLIMLMRRVLKDIEYKGYTIPKGSLVSVSPALTHNLDEFWPNPNKFDPDRHLNAPVDRYAYVAFGAGRHKCSGELFAYLQVKTIWSTLLRKYDLELVGDLPNPDFTTLIAGPQPPCLIRYKKKTL